MCVWKSKGVGTRNKTNGGIITLFFGACAQEYNRKGHTPCMYFWWFDIIKSTLFQFLKMFIGF